MSFLDKLSDKYTGLQTVFKSFFVLIILFLVFFAVNLFLLIQNRPKSAYSTLNEEASRLKIMLQDTRMHNWDEIDKKDKK